ncbi:MAG: ATP-binding protein [Peptococcaceae bacterium]|nr:ATP-binding protein [Peptococcaceae bacterium]
MIAKVYSCTILGLQVSAVEVEAGVYGGLPEFLLVGLPDAAVRESRERVRAALVSSGYRWPARRLIVNLAPADLRKEGGGLDLAVAAGILTATEQLGQDGMEEYVFMGELSLDGSLRPTRGVLPAALSLAGVTRRFLVVPEENYAEACRGTVQVIPLAHLSQLRELTARKKAVESGILGAGPAGKLFFGRDKAEGACGQEKDEAGDKEKEGARGRKEGRIKSAEKSAGFTADLTMVRGQLQARRALELAAAGNLSLMLLGPPGCGKSLLARCLPSILPPLDQEEALMVNRIYSSAGLLTPDKPWISERPFRSPHCGITKAGLLGGGQPFLPGEISLAQHGVLYLDELPELDKNVLESLRQPLEEGRITLRRAWGSVTMPASFQLVASANPCPCGFYGDGRVECRCSDFQLRRYRARLSGPLLDRLDMIVHVPRLGPELFQDREALPETSAAVAARVARVRQIQKARGPKAALTIKDLQDQLAGPAKKLAALAYEERLMTARGYYRLLLLSRTVSDLAEEEKISQASLAEALQYRQEFQS